MTTGPSPTEASAQKTAVVVVVLPAASDVSWAVPFGLCPFPRETSAQKTLAVVAVLPAGSLGLYIYGSQPGQIESNQSTVVSAAVVVITVVFAVAQRIARPIIGSTVVRIHFDRIQSAASIRFGITRRIFGSTRQDIWQPIRSDRIQYINGIVDV